ncbi:hypothetical protein F5J12DRAFT_786515 [Pisolithus orientalis]|uniref:uncharacterized protein n=1 Tax=Pisolithus orientalis TaxID=936130 RepID=UPI002224144E|nr:uncharacterized protein F5J12DRAFT_786515 [Pisolithus orientalis]KAI5990289.1 hypothetical protein F5J12DRAFT_786515 [Pisolithus orientalis]
MPASCLLKWCMCEECIMKNTNDNGPDPDTQPPVPQVGQLPSSSSSSKVSKKAHNQHLVKALKLISNIEAPVHKCSCLLLDNSGACIAALRTEMAVLYSNMEGIKCNTDFVKSHKQDALPSSFSQGILHNLPLDCNLLCNLTPVKMINHQSSIWIFVAQVALVIGVATTGSHVMTVYGQTSHQKK